MPDPIDLSKDAFRRLNGQVNRNKNQIHPRRKRDLPTAIDFYLVKPEDDIAKDEVGNCAIQKYGDEDYNNAPSTSFLQCVAVGGIAKAGTVYQANRDPFGTWSINTAKPAESVLVVFSQEEIAIDESGEATVLLEDGTEDTIEILNYPSEFAETIPANVNVWISLQWVDDPTDGLVQKWLPIYHCGYARFIKLSNDSNAEGGPISMTNMTDYYDGAPPVSVGSVLNPFAFSTGPVFAMYDPANNSYIAVAGPSDNPDCGCCECPETGVETDKLIKIASWPISGGTVEVWGKVSTLILDEDDVLRFTMQATIVGSGSGQFKWGCTISTGSTNVTAMYGSLSEIKTTTISGGVFTETGTDTISFSKSYTYTPPNPTGRSFTLTGFGATPINDPIDGPFAEWVFATCASGSGGSGPGAVT